MAPVPGLADLDGLLAEVAKAGLAVRLRVEGTPSPLPAGVDLSAYRIVQEALTNVVKHAGPARSQVTIGYGDREVTVEITDNGRGMAAPTGDGGAELGHGLIGMQRSRDNGGPCLAWPCGTNVMSGAGRPTRVTAMPHARAALAPPTRVARPRPAASIRAASGSQNGQCYPASG